MSFCLTDKKSCKKQKTNIVKKKRPSIILKIKKQQKKSKKNDIKTCQNMKKNKIKE